MNDLPAIRLHQFPPVWGRNVSPFTLKVEAWLILAGLPYVVMPVRNPARGPKGKLPFIEDGGRRIADSSLILDHLRRTRGVDPDAGLDAAARAEALALQRLFEDHFYFVMVYARWLDPAGWRATRQGLFGTLPPGARQIVASIVRRKIRRDLLGHGIARHGRDEVYAMGRADLEAVATYLDEGPFFFRDRPTTIDAIAYAFLANILLVPVETELKRITEDFANLRAFTQTMDELIEARRHRPPEAEREPAKASGATEPTTG